MDDTLNQNTVGSSLSAIQQSLDILKSEVKALNNNGHERLALELSFIYRYTRAALKNNRLLLADKLAKINIKIRAFRDSSYTHLAAINGQRIVLALDNIHNNLENILCVIRESDYKAIEYDEKNDIIINRSDKISSSAVKSPSIWALIIFIIIVIKIVTGLNRPNQYSIESGQSIPVPESARNAAIKKHREDTINLDSEVGPLPVPDLF